MNEEVLVDTPSQPHRAPRTRGITAWIPVILASALDPRLGHLGVGDQHHHTDTNKYVSTMAPLATNPVIVNRLA
jgi:hypothetical protein